MLEKDIEKAVCDYAKAKGLTPYKFTSPNRASVPDRLFLGYPNLHFFIEFKAPGKKNTPAQDREQERLREMCQHVHVVDDIDKGKEIIDQELEFPLWS